MGIINLILTNLYWIILPYFLVIMTNRPTYRIYRTHYLPYSFNQSVLALCGSCSQQAAQTNGSTFGKDQFDGTNCQTELWRP